MKTYISDLIPKLLRFSQKLDSLTMLTNQHWVVMDDVTKTKVVYIFRTNNELLISQNGKVETAQWDYLGNNSLLIDRKGERFIYKQSFFDENILALKIDSNDGYAILINENKYEGELNSIDSILDFLKQKYIDQEIRQTIEESIGVDLGKSRKMISTKNILLTRKTNKGILEIEQTHVSFSEFHPGQKVFLNGKPAPDGKYNLGFMWTIYVKDGLVKKHTF